MLFAFNTALAAVLLTAVAVDGRLVVHEKRDAAPSHWKRSSFADPDQVLPMRVALSVLRALTTREELRLTR